MKNSTKNLLLSFLALVALGGGVLAWQQYLELVALRTAAAGSTDRAADQARLVAAQRYTRELEEQLAALRDKNQSAADATTPARDANQGFGGRGRGGPANMR